MGMKWTSDDDRKGLNEMKTDMFAIRLNCSNKFLGRKVIMVYFEVIT